MPTDTPTKPKPPGKLAAEKLTPEAQLKRFHDAVGSPAHGDTSKASAQPSTDGLTQSERFIKAARELGTDDDPERFKERIRKLAKAPQVPAPGGKTNSSDS